MGWWDFLHPTVGDFHANLGVPVALDCAKALAGEKTVIKNGFDGFHGTQLHAYLQEQKVMVLELYTHCGYKMFPTNILYS